MTVKIVYTETINGEYTNRKIEFVGKSGKKYEVDLIFAKDFTPPTPSTLKSGKKYIEVDKANIKIFKSIVPAISDKGVLSGAYEFTKVMLVNSKDKVNKEDEDEDLPF